MVHILIAGGGSIGTVLGLLLQEKGNRVVLLRKRPPFGLLSIQLIGEKSLESEIKVISNRDKIKNWIFDIIFITSQRQQLELILENLSNIADVDNKTIFVTLQNGLGSPELVKKLFPNNSIIQGTIWWSATLINSNLVYYHRKSATFLGIPKISKSTEEDLKTIYNLLSDIFEVYISKDIEADMRKKLILNVISPVLALLKLPYPEGINNFKAREVVHILLDEAYAIARKLKWNVEDERLNNFHNLVSSKTILDIEHKSRLPIHKVSTQIGCEKYGGRGSNATELLSFFIESGAKDCEYILNEVNKLPKNYKPVSEIYFEEIWNKVKIIKTENKISCPLTRNDMN